MSDVKSIGAEIAQQIGSDSESLVSIPSIDPSLGVNHRESVVDRSSNSQILDAIEEVSESDVEMEGEVKAPSIKDEIDKVLNSSEEDAVDELQDEAKKEEDSKFASKFAALSRKEKAIRERESQIEARLKEFEEKEQRLQQLESLEEQILRNPIKWLDEKGVDFEALTQMQLNDLNPTPEMLYERLEKKFESQLEEKTKALREQYLKEKEEEAERKYEQTINSFMEEIADHVNSAEDEYELIKANDSVQAVYDVIEQYHAKTGKILEVKEAADYVESHLYEEAQKLLKLKKLQAMRDKQEAETTKKVDGIEQNKKTGVTLSNSQTTQVPSETSRLLSRDESLAEAAKRLQWND